MIEETDAATICTMNPDDPPCCAADAILIVLHTLPQSRVTGYLLATSAARRADRRGRYADGEQWGQLAHYYRLAINEADEP